MAVDYHFSFGVWNVGEGADPFGGPVREALEHEQVFAKFRELGFDRVMAHDDELVPDPDNKSAAEIQRAAKEARTRLEGFGLVAEGIGPRLWDDPIYAAGAFTNPDAKIRQKAIDRAKKSADICGAVGCPLLNFWLARDGSYIRESKDAAWGVDQIVALYDTILDYGPSDLKLSMEPKPNEPMDQTLCPTAGHALAVAARTKAPERVGVLLESAHAVLANLDPADEFAFALSFGKLFGVHLNDQNGPKYDQDKAFGAANLRGAFNQVRVLEQGGYGANGETVAFDVRPMRTTSGANRYLHLKTSRDMFLALVDKVRSYDTALEQQYLAAQDYESLELYVLRHLMGI